MALHWHDLVEGVRILGSVLDTAVQTEESGRPCALAELTGFICYTDFADWIAQSSLETLVCHIYYYIPIIKPASQPFTPLST